MWRSVPGAGVLVVRDCRVLMVMRERAGKYRWELPSGVVDSGESFEETAAREALEETGIPVAIGPLLCTAVMDVAKAEYRGINAYFAPRASRRSSCSATSCPASTARRCCAQVAEDAGLASRYAYVLVTAQPDGLPASLTRLLARLGVAVVGKPFDIDRFLDLVASTARRL